MRLTKTFDPQLEPIIIGDRETQGVTHKHFVQQNENEKWDVTLSNNPNLSIT